MLVLSRKIGEKIVINNNIEITIVSVDRGKVRIGVVAPKDVPVNRLEIQTKIDQTKNAPAPEEIVSQSA